jgi:hypothetical protein
MPPRFGWGNRQGGNRGLGGLPESRSPWLHRLGGVHGQSAPLGGQRQPRRSGTHRRAAQRFGVATGHRNLRPLWTSHEPALHGGRMATTRSIAAGSIAISEAALRQEVRALPVDALVERLLLDALVPDQIAIAIAAMGQLEEESRQLERQWTLRRERARYEAERARRQYDAVEPENRLVARSLERTWEEKLRDVDAIEEEHARWRSQEPLGNGAADRAELQALGENLPRIWHAVTTAAADRKRILRFVVREVVLDQRRAQGQVWLKIVWQTGATSEHCLQRRVHTYRDYIDLERLRRRITELNNAGKMDKEIAASLNQEGFVAARGCAFKGENVWLLRTRWKIPTTKINGASANPMRWPDGTFSIQGVAVELGITHKPCSTIWPVAIWLATS